MITVMHLRCAAVAGCDPHNISPRPTYKKLSKEMITLLQRRANCEDRSRIRERPRGGTASKKCGSGKTKSSLTPAFLCPAICPSTKADEIQPEGAPATPTSTSASEPTGSPPCRLRTILAAAGAEPPRRPSQTDRRGGCPSPRRRSAPGGSPFPKCRLSPWRPEARGASSRGCPGRS